MTDALVSIIMPTYNAGRFIADSIESILAQTYPHWELLITDDHSTDPLTLDTLRRYEKQDGRINVVYLTENRGPGYSRNKSIERAAGRYIAFCDGDDCWMPDKLERQLAYMEEQQCALCYASYILRDENDTDRGIVIAPKQITLRQLKHDNKVGCLTAVYDTKRLGQKYFMPALRKRQDWALFLNILKQCGTACAITDPLAYYRIRQQSVSSNKLGLIKYNVLVYQKVFGYSPLKARLYFTFIFLPTHFWKLLRRQIDSWRFLRKKK
ncbi:MAG: glycosyltransferase family 2 protein [Prevotella sp.]|nr:glycosyltransferase family 2 protein [Prevotella sp.]